ncbi:MAG TPA: hypothetical protein VHK28_11220, partial [Candidatus Limnocylindria bacterium]|nr:hypothetical protein [Candidatus Limnocylindria bacterium]
MAADARRELNATGLELLAQAAWWSGRLDVSLDARERAYSQAVKAKDSTTAVVAAIGLGRDNLLRMNTTVAAAWLNRADRLLEGVPENLGHGWLAGSRAFLHALGGDNDASLAQATTAHEIAVRIGDRDLEIFALGAKASALMARGDVKEG